MLGPTSDPGGVDPTTDAAAHSSAGGAAGVDLELRRTLEVALRIGEALLSSGDSAAETTQAVRRVLSGCHVGGVDVDVTFNSITVSTRQSSLREPLTLMRVVKSSGRDYSRIARTESLAERLSSRQVTVGEAARELDSIDSLRRPWRDRLSVLAWAIAAGNIAALFGGDVAIALVSAVGALTLLTVGRGVRRAGLPAFFTQVTGGFSAAMVAALAALSGVAHRPGLVLAATIVILLAGTTLTGGLEDAFSEYYITAGARLLEAFVLTGGLIAGVSAGLEVSVRMGVTFPGGAHVSSQVGLGPSMIFAAIAAASAAYAGRAPKRYLLAAAAAGAVSQGVFWLTGDLLVTGAWATAIAAGVIGFSARFLSRFWRVPAAITVAAGTLPLLPGLGIYNGMYRLTDAQNVDGILTLIAALGTAAAISAGVLVGKTAAHLSRVRPPDALPVPTPLAAGSAADEEIYVETSRDR